MRKVLADMHVPPAWRRWITRVALSLAVALVVAYVPYRLTGGGDDRALRLRRQLEQTRTEIGRLEAANARLLREIDALQRDVGAIEDRARDELGMVYPDELVLRIVPAASGVSRPSCAPTDAACGGAR